MGYELTTLGQLITALSVRLSDTSFVFWNKDEMRAYLIEALRTWQAHSNYYTSQAQLTTTANTQLYNILSLLPVLVPTVTDQDVIKDVERYLQEPVNATGWSGTQQFSYAGIVQALANRRDRFILETGLVQSISEVPGPPPSQSTIELDDHVINVRRVVWKLFGFNTYTLLYLADEFSLTGGNADWFTSPGSPTDYSLTLDQPLTLQLAPPPSNLGTVNLITVNSGPVLNPSAGATVLGIPDDFVWVVKWGVLADLFSTPGPGTDPLRAAYCESRWSDGIELARITNLVRLGQNNGVPSFVDSMEELDTGDPEWVNEAAGIPDTIAVAGNIVATRPIADGTYSLLFDIVPNVPIPVDDGHFVQVGQEFVDIILDYAQHLAQVKVGVEEITSSYRLYQNFMKAAAVENDVLRANAQSFDALNDRTQRNAQESPRRKSDVSLEPLSY